MVARRNALVVASLFIAGAFGVRAWPSGEQGSPSNPVAVDQSKLPPGYLSRDQLPDSLALLPPPPTGAIAMRGDEEARRAALRLRGTGRYALAASDAVIGFPELPDDFSCAAGAPLSKEATPRTYALLARMAIDLGLSTYRAKNRYKRVRPFVMHKAITCYPKDEAFLREDGSYPSGHSAIGWGYALVLAELVPARADALLQRGREFGQSRLVCDAHWQSDIDAGRLVAAATVARLHADPAFRADLDAARAELSVPATVGHPPGPNCEREGMALRGQAITAQ